MNEHTHKQKKNGCSKPNSNRCVDVDGASVVPGGAGPGGGVDKGVEGTAKDGSSALGGEPASVSAEVRS